MLSGLFPVIASATLPIVFMKNSERKQEMKLLKDSLDKAIKELGQKDEAYVLRLMDIIEKMATDLKPSVRAAVDPIGKTCNTLTIKSNTRSDTYDVKDKEIICKDQDNELTETRSFEVLITELDSLTASCKVKLPEFEGDHRISGKITDPIFDNKNDPYSVAFAAKEWITVLGKGQLKDGELVKLFISDLNV